MKHGINQEDWDQAFKAYRSIEVSDAERHEMLSHIRLGIDQRNQKRRRQSFLKPVLTAVILGACLLIGGYAVLNQGILPGGVYHGAPYDPWEPSPTFMVDDRTLHGTEDKFGIIKVNGYDDEPAFPAGKGRHYHIYFLDTEQDINGQTYKMTATSQATGETIELYEWDIQNNQSGAKFGINEKGLWRFDVTVDGQAYTSFVVEVK
ncbi:hypothetical protein [Caldalkalibacillus salinus]|uniref:hypothetical protein n=1 Tax=Caldalkalibacillus salinus TaxID=2803787 RepID=UPI0019228047|nr:hypothetical protein [Caldalkalibacillus salinus]